MNLFTKQKQTQRLRIQTNLWLPKGKAGGGGINRQFAIDTYTLLYLK